MGHPNYSWCSQKMYFKENRISSRAVSIHRHIYTLYTPTHPQIYTHMYVHIYLFRGETGLLFLKRAISVTGYYFYKQVIAWNKVRDS